MHANLYHKSNSEVWNACVFVFFLHNNGHVVSCITALQLKLIKRDEHITSKFAFANGPVEIRSKNCFGMSFRGTMTQDRFLVSPLFLSINWDFVFVTSKHAVVLHITENDSATQEEQQQIEKVLDATAVDTGESSAQSQGLFVEPPKTKKSKACQVIYLS